MKKPIVVYTDPAWAITASGASDPAAAWVEREVFGNSVELRLGTAVDGKYRNDPATLRNLLADASALAIYRAQITPEVLKQAGATLRVVARQGVGFDNLNPDLLRRNGIIGFNIPDYCVDEVATHTTAMALALERGLIVQDQSLKAGKFNIYTGGSPRRLRTAHAGLIGFGRIGRSVATRLSAFYGSLMAYDPYVSSDQMAAFGVRKVTLDELLSTADLISLHCPLNEATHNLLDQQAFSKMQPTAFVINAARGALIDAAALHNALQNRQIAGAGIDVFTPEDPHESEIYRKVLAMPNVVVTSHRAFLSTQAEISQRRRVAEGIYDVLNHGNPPAIGHLTEGVVARGIADLVS